MELDQRNSLALQELNRQIDELAAIPLDSSLPLYLDDIEYIPPPTGFLQTSPIGHTNQENLTLQLENDLKDFRTLAKSTSMSPQDQLQTGLDSFMSINSSPGRSYGHSQSGFHSSPELQRDSILKGDSFDFIRDSEQLLSKLDQRENDKPAQHANSGGITNESIKSMQLSDIKQDQVPLSKLSKDTEDLLMQLEKNDMPKSSPMRIQPFPLPKSDPFVPSHVTESPLYKIPDNKNTSYSANQLAANQALNENTQFNASYQNLANFSSRLSGLRDSTESNAFVRPSSPVNSTPKQEEIENSRGIVILISNYNGFAHIARSGGETRRR